MAGMEIDGSQIIGLPVTYNAERVGEVAAVDYAAGTATLKVDLSKLNLPAKFFEGVANSNYSSAVADARAFGLSILSSPQAEQSMNAVPITEGPCSKGGQNPDTMTPRPPAPQGSGGPSVRKHADYHLRRSMQDDCRRQRQIAKFVLSSMQLANDLHQACEHRRLAGGSKELDELASNLECLIAENFRDTFGHEIIAPI